MPPEITTQGKHVQKKKVHNQPSYLAEEASGTLRWKPTLTLPLRTTCLEKGGMGVTASVCSHDRKCLENYRREIH